MRRSTRCASLVIVTMLGCGGGDGGTGPSINGPSVRVVAGDGLTDTVRAKPLQALIVEVRDSANRLQPGVLVRFQALPQEDPARPFESAISVAEPSSNDFGQFATGTTDTQGRTLALVQLGTVAGPARIEITVPLHGVADTANYTVTAGAVFKIFVAPADTAVRVGRSYTPNASSADRFGNRRPDPLTFWSATAACSVDAQGRISAAAVGRCAIGVRAGTIVDSARASVVPAGTLVAMSIGGAFFPGSVISVDLDGSNARRIAALQSGEAFPAASPGGTEVAFRELDRLFVVDDAGTRRALVVPASGLFFEGFPRYSRDGAWVYFAGGSAVRLFRVHPNGTGLESTGPSTGLSYASEPDPSPDGARIAYYGDDEIRVFTLATGNVSTVAGPGTMPRWSPDGTRIAYLGVGGIRIVNADGSGDHLISPHGGFFDNSGLDWTADGEWILGRAESMLELLNAATGVVLPLPYSAGLYQPAVVR